MSAAEMGISGTCAYRCGPATNSTVRPAWPIGQHRPPSLPRCLQRGGRDLPAAPHPHKLGPARIAPRVGRPASTVHRVLVRHGLGRLAVMDRATGRVIRRYERARPGELVHVDVKKLGRIPDLVAGAPGARDGPPPSGQGPIGYDFIYVHSAVTTTAVLGLPPRCLADETRGDGRRVSGARAQEWFRARGVVVERVMTDNAFALSLARCSTQALAAHRIAQRTAGPTGRRPTARSSGSTGTLLEEWAYVRPYTRNRHRTRALARWLHMYNHHRPHTSLWRLHRPPISRVTNGPGSYI